MRFLPLFFFFAACSTKQDHPTVNAYNAHTNTKIQNGTLSPDSNRWQENFGLTHNPEVDTIWHKPVKFYLDNPKCSALAKDFYLGNFRPTDNDKTATLLMLATTENDSLRPFYRWCLSKTIQIQDGALAEYTGIAARQYAEKFPEEFFKYMDADPTKERYNAWVGAISYSGFYNTDDYKNPQNIRKDMKRAMNQHCVNCSQQLKQRIDSCAADCFSQLGPL